MSDFSGTITELLTKVRETQNSVAPRISEISSQCERLSNAGQKVAESWSGSFLGYHSELYYRDFEKPPLGDRFSPEWGGIHGIPDGWSPKSAEEVKQRIERLANANIDTVEKESKACVDKAKDLRDEILIELAPIRRESGNEQEKELLSKLEAFEWGKTTGEFIHVNTPGTFMTRDSMAMAEGARIPAHLYYEAVAYASNSRCKAIEDFWKLSQRLLRQIQVQAGQPIPQQAGAYVPLNLVKFICRHFHVVASQLMQRRENRATLTIKDEYDVQDLTHALLRLHFEDIRPEEWTPSYGGGASRMDFLLNKEQIVIEAKMARPGLGAKEISEQLIIDATKYKEHPKCKSLVCFVYDPASFVKNPRGVESDLERLSSEELEVLCIIVP